MPYKKNYGRKPYKKRSYKKKPFKRFTKSYNKPKYDGAIAIKCFQVQPVVFQTVGGAYFIHGWGQNGTTTTNVATIDDNLEFLGYMSLYKQWKLKGIKMKFTPVREVSSVVNSSLGVIQSATDTDGGFGALNPDSDLQARIDFKTYYGAYKRYYKCGKFYKGQSQSWINTSTYYTPVTTKHSFATTGYTNGNIVGYMETTYYVMFKAQ